ncbi:MAG: hypothetical protein EBX70_07960 [Betaproteobacteria bacterium]|nr:hypothetical protein [Betaproteobacteria bacterium]
MKLEMRAWDLDVRVELEDDDSLDQLAVLTVVRDLLDTLSQYEKVDISIKQVADPEDHNDHEDDAAHAEAQADYKVSLVA